MWENFFAHLGVRLFLMHSFNMANGSSSFFFLYSRKAFSIPAWIISNDENIVINTGFIGAKCNWIGSICSKADILQFSIISMQRVWIIFFSFLFQFLSFHLCDNDKDDCFFRFEANGRNKKVRLIESYWMKFN